MLNSALFRLMRHKEGMMGVAIAWLLRKRGITWEATKYIKEQEMDLIADIDGRKIVIENKAFLSDNDKGALNRKISSDLIRFEKKFIALNGTVDGKPTDWYFIVNLPKELLESLPIKPKHGVRLISVDDVPSILNDYAKKPEDSHNNKKSNKT